MSLIHDQIDATIRDKSESQLQSLCRGLMCLLSIDPEHLNNIVKQPDVFYMTMFGPSLDELWRYDTLCTLQYLRDIYKEPTDYVTATDRHEDINPEQPTSST